MDRRGQGIITADDSGRELTQKKVSSGQFGNLAFSGIEVDRFRQDREIYVRCTGRGWWYRFSEKNEQFSKVTCPGTGGAAGTCIVPGPEGILYAPVYPYHLCRFTREGKPFPWPEGYKRYPEEAMGKTGKMQKLSKKVPAHGRYVPVSMVFMTHTLGVRYDGNIFMFEAGNHGGRPPKMLREYLPTGERKSDTPIIWKASDTVIGPKFDPQGNIYIADQIKPLDEPYPEEFKEVVGEVKPDKMHLGKFPVKNACMTMYGSIMKFSPKGGMIHFGGKNPYKGDPKLDPSLKTVTAGSYHGYRFYTTKVTGALWIKPGISHVDLHYCNCENTRFDVDEFGRVWYPDLGRFRVCVLDTNGNDITYFGGYGNSDSHGPDTEDKKLAEPEIPLAWLIGVGVTDKYVYLPDSMNRRLLRCRITYKEEKTCEIRDQ
ncbi:hypothetical protein ACFL6F_03810 [Planctomycetota bacterium]